MSEPLVLWYDVSGWLNATKNIAFQIIIIIKRMFNHRDCTIITNSENFENLVMFASQKDKWKKHFIAKKI